jgi:2,3-bisphosphoglycerate-independent phosphoglycerate mutase
MDPQRVGVPVLPVNALRSNSERSACLANQFVERASQLLSGKQPANMIMLRGFSKYPIISTYSELFGLRAAAIAVNGMYRGVAKLVGMQVLPVYGDRLEDEFSALEKSSTLISSICMSSNDTADEAEERKYQ